MSTTRPISALSALAGAWGLLGRDPVRLLTLSGAALLADLLLVSGLVVATAGGSAPPLGMLFLAWLARCALAGPLRGLVLAFGGHARTGRAVDGVRRSGAAAVVEIATGVACALAICAASLPFAALASAVGLQGLLPGVVAFGVLGVVSAWFALLGVRAALASALPHAVIGGHGAVRSLGFALRDARSNLGFSLIVIALSDALRLVGALAVAVGALPALPLPLLAWLHRLGTPPPAASRSAA